MILKKFDGKIEGFTLVEILVAMVILSLLASGFFSVMISGRQMVARSKKRLVATEIARREIENKRQNIRADLWTCSTLWPIGSWTIPVASGDYSYRYRIDNVPGADYRKITVEVRWNDATI